MGYTALYRKYRPVTFSEVRGQEHIVTTLRNQVRADRTGHAYLLCGTRGTGKTTVAKILARAVNCLNPADGEPCGECASCRAILEGKSMNVIEIDAASNNGVDNIRTIREEVAYPPAEGKKKVYIIDEVHMLSTGAFNALLKTLEEPPSYVLFILATTEAHKIPVTILSRCQRYDFRRITVADISARLDQLLQEEGVEAEPEAVQYIARKADGGMRDALSLADRCISFYLGERLTYEKVLDVLGAVDTEVYSRMLRNLLKEDAGALLLQFSDQIEAGKDLTALVSDLTGYLRDILLLKASEQTAPLLDVSQEQMPMLLEDAASVRDETLMRYIQVLSDLSAQMRYAYNRRVLAEVALIRLCRPQMQKDELSFGERLRRLEKIAASGVMVRAAGEGAPPGASVHGAASGRAFDPAPAGFREGAAVPDKEEDTDSMLYSQKAAPEDLQQIEAMWSGIIAGASPQRFREVLGKTVRMFDPADEQQDLLIVAFTNFLGQSYVGNQEKTAQLEQLISEKIGKAIRVRMILREDAPLQKEKLAMVKVTEDRLRSHIAMDIETDPEEI